MKQIKIVRIDDMRGVNCVIYRRRRWLYFWGKMEAVYINDPVNTPSALRKALVKEGVPTWPQERSPDERACVYR